HMPSHIYLRTGDWAAAIEANEHSWHYGHDYLIADDPKAELILCGHEGAFITYAYMMLGNEVRARESALHDCKGHHGESVGAFAVLLRFHVGEDVLAFPEPAEDWWDGFWHFGRGLAFTAQGRLDRGEQELKVLQPDQAPPPTMPESHSSLDL